jgi:hypothetical protein
MLLIYAEENAQAAAQPPAGISQPWLDYTAWLEDQGIHVGGERLASSASATTVRVRDNERLITDGPFAETKEVLGGYYIIECRDLDQALVAAARCPGAIGGSVEVRPLLALPGMTGPDSTAPTAASSGR